MKLFLILLFSLLSTVCYSQSKYTHSAELGIAGNPKTIITQSYEARIGKDNKYEKAARYPYGKEITRFMPNGNIANSISYWFDNIHAPYTDTVEMTRTEYTYNGNKCTGLIIYSNDVKYLKSKRTWQNNLQYTDSTYVYTSRTDSTGKLIGITETTLNITFYPLTTKRTEFYKVMRSYGEGSSATVNLRENQPPIVITDTVKETAVYTTKDDKGNKLTSIYETGFSAYKEYMMEEYSYEYY
ncbi:MAG TPA: hypothetical protein VK167_11760 [Flavipsychrobacter sp.]|nr:hypothetical protein [Flavipsychrobacter sp.]